MSTWVECAADVAAVACGLFVQVLIRQQTPKAAAPFHSWRLDFVHDFVTAAAAVSMGSSCLCELA
jgi:hypothetical protein